MIQIRAKQPRLTVLQWIAVKKRTFRVHNKSDKEIGVAYKNQSHNPITITSLTIAASAGTTKHVELDSFSDKSEPSQKISMQTLDSNTKRVSIERGHGYEETNHVAVRNQKSL